MSTNYYWKELPQWFYDNIPKKTLKMYMDEENNILIHIGKRSMAGKYCSKCGIVQRREGTREVHSSSFSLSQIAILTKEQKQKIQDSFYYKKCPCCGGSFKDDDKNIILSCSFTWSMYRHKWLIIEQLENKDKIIVDEYGKELSAYDFIHNVLANTIVEEQLAVCFS